VSRGGPPQSGSLWDDLPEPESEVGPSPGHEAPGAEAATPEWALPAWDSLSEGGAETAEGAAAEAEPSAPAGEEPAAALKILQVSEITRAVRDAIRARPDLRDVWVEGEVGRVTVSAAGHAYFTLKDERSQLACVFFRDERARSPFEPRTGLRVVAHGRVDIFESQGVYQLYVTAVQPAGFGDLALRFEALKARLAAEGLFDSARKRPLPARPRVIGVATSATGAVWHDICHVVARRWPLARLLLSPCQVQGEGSAQSVATALDRLARWGELCVVEGRPEDAPAVVILARGGGSLEDLWSFNDERVVRAVV
jgi:exodeoxyribonuclease VII large subunit